MTNTNSPSHSETRSLMALLRQKDKLSSCFPCICICFVAFVYALVQAIRTCNGQWDSMVASMLLALAVVYFGLIRFMNGADNALASSVKERIVAWAILLIAICIPPIFATSPTELPHNTAVALFAIACILFFHGWRPALWMSPALIIFCMFIPMREQIMLMVSYPLRLISTAFSVVVLKLLQVNIEYHLTTITLPGSTQIVITDACSGIQQLEALLLIGYLIIHLQPKPLVWSICHYLFLLPIIILSNSVRIIATILLYHAIGPADLNITWHTTLGYCLVFACAILFWYSGLLFPTATSESSKPDNA